MDKCDRFEEKSRGQRTVESGRSPGLGTLSSSKGCQHAVLGPPGPS